MPTTCKEICTYTPFSVFFFYVENILQIDIICHGFARLIVNQLNPVFMQSNVQKEELKHILLMCNVHAPALIEFLEDSIETQKKVQEVADDVRLDFKVIQAELFLSAIRS